MMRRWIYPVLVLVILSIWAMYMLATNQFGLFKPYWPLSLTMLFGSFVAGATPQGGAAVAFPVFTKVFQIPSADARTFGLMIQSFGMTMASITILLRRTPLMPRVLLWSCVGGAIGVTLGTLLITIPNPYPKILFTISLTVFGVALFISRWILRWPVTNRIVGWNIRHILVFATVSCAGGIFAAYTGAGVDGMIFIVLTLAFGIDERMSTPTTVIVMAVVSIVGFALHGLVVQDIGIVKNYWLVAVPIVIIGAPLGAYFLTKISRDVLIVAILVLIATEMLSTAILTPFTGTMIAVTGAVMLMTAFIFCWMLYYRYQHRPSIDIQPVPVAEVSAELEQPALSPSLPEKSIV